MTFTPLAITGEQVPVPGKNPAGLYALTYASEHRDGMAGGSGENAHQRLITREDLERNVNVFATEVQTGRHFGMRLLEDARHDGRRVIGIVTSRALYGASRRLGGARFAGMPFLCFGPGAPGAGLTGGDGAAIASLVTNRSADVICNVENIIGTPDIGTFLADLVETVIRSPEQVPLVIYIDVLQSIIGRKRFGYDGAAIKAFQALLNAARDRDVVFIMVSDSGDDIPVEFRNAGKTRLVCRASTKEEVRAIAKITEDDVARKANEDYGALHIHDSLAWIKPGHRYNQQHLLALAALPLSSNAGPNGGKGLEPDAEEQPLHDRIVAARAEAAADQNGPTGSIRTSRMRGMRPRLPQRKFRNHPDDANPMDVLRAKGITYLEPTIALARASISIDRVGTIDTSLMIRTQEIVDWVERNPSATNSVAFAYRRLKGHRGLLPPVVVALAHHRGGEPARVVLDGIGGKGRQDGIIANALRALFVPDLPHQQRFDVVNAAVAARTATAQEGSSGIIAANDDERVRQAV